MKSKTAIVLFILLWLSVFLFACNQNVFDGTLVADSYSYVLNVEKMTGTDTHTLTLNAGDVLRIRFETERGKLQLEIKSPSGGILYSGNGESATDFTLNVSESGNYSVYVKAQKAKGTIDIQLQNKQS